MPHLDILRLHVTNISAGNPQKTGRQKNQHFFCHPDLCLGPPHGALGANLVGNHGIHDDVKAVAPEAVHDRGYVTTKSLAFRVVTAVEKFCRQR